MKNVKTILILLVIAVMTFGTVLAFAADELPATEKKDRFTVMESETDKNGTFSMINHGRVLVIHVSDETPIFLEDGSDVRDILEEGESLAEFLNDRMLVVTYSIETKSLPPQTSPDKIVVMFEEIMPLPETVGALNGEIVVEGDIIKAPAPYLKDKVIMVPLRAIAEALEFDVNWDKEVKGVRVGNAINLWIGQDNYTVGRMAPITLGTAPELKDGHTYVPMSFFGTVITEYKGYWFEGQVVIEDVLTSDME